MRKCPGITGKVTQRATREVTRKKEKNEMFHIQETLDIHIEKIQFGKEKVRKPCKIKAFGRTRTHVLKFGFCIPVFHIP